MIFVTSFRRIVAMMFIMVSFYGCKKLEQNIDLKLPPFEPQLQVECYLENYREGCSFGGIPIPIPYSKASLTQTQDYFGTLDTPFINTASVVVSYGGKDFKLLYNSFPDVCDTASIKLFNYKNFDSTFKTEPQKTYSLRIEGKNGEVLTAETQCLNIVEIDTIQQTYNPDADRTFLITYFTDDASTTDFYRMRYNNLSDKTGDKRMRDVIQSDITYNGARIPFGASVKYNEGDTIECTVYHITKEYYDYVRTKVQASSSEGNPFGSPAFIQSNVSGGAGIFTCLMSSRKRVLLKK